MNEQKLKIYSCMVHNKGLYNNKNIIMYDSCSHTKDVYGFLCLGLINISKRAKDDYKLDDYVYKSDYIIGSSLKLKPLELTFDVLCLAYDQIKNIPSPVHHYNHQCVKLCIELLELIMINYNE